ncbi:hypothetical protein MUP77_19530 [Candidatus Bathyarchaeota archaeon]|nr:hypothetical protein [Candidatus Bathyarchaeota archaeon]
MSSSNPELNTKVIEKIAKIINNLQLGDIVTLFLESLKPMSQFLGQMTYITTFPVREVLALGWPEFHALGDMMAINPAENIDRIVEEIKKEKK